MGLKKLLIATGVLAALGVALWLTSKHPEWATKSGNSPTNEVKLLNVPEPSIEKVEVQKKGAPLVSLERNGSKWTVKSQDAFPADQEAATALANSAGPLNADSVVEAKAVDLKKYGLAEPSLAITLREKGGKSDRILIGDDLPTGSLTYARVNNDPAVYAFPTSVKTAFDKSVNDLRDKRLLTFNSNQLTRIQVTAAAKPPIELGKNGQNDWAIIQPGPYRADSFQVEELLRKLSDAKMDLQADPKVSGDAEKSFAAGKPASTIKLTDSGGAQTLELRKNKDDYFAKSSVVSGSFKVAADLGQQLEKSVDDFRNKKVFDFGFSDPTRIELQDKTLVRVATDWKMNGQTMDAGGVQSLIDKLRDLSASKFESTGFTSPTTTVTVISNEGKRTEKVEFAKIGDGYLARRAGEAALYVLDAKAVNDMLKDGSSLKPAAKSK